MPGSPGSPKKGMKRMFSAEEETTIGDFLISCWGKYLKVPQKVLYDTLKKHLDKFSRKTSFKDNRPGLFWRQKFFQRNSHVEEAFNKYKQSGRTEVETVPDDELLVLLQNLEKAEKQPQDGASSDDEVTPPSSAKKLKKKKVRQNLGDSSDSEDLPLKVRKGVVRKRSKTSDPKKLSGAPRRGRPPLKVGGNLVKRDKSAPPGAAESREGVTKVEAKKTVESPAPSKGVRSSIAPDAVPLNPVKHEEGEAIEAMDCGKWYNAKIVEVDSDKGEVLVHYNGWGKKFDTVFPVGSTLIRGSTQKEKRPDVEKFNIGDDVLSKWTDGNFYPGTVISVNKAGSYTVMFYDGLKKLLRPPFLKRMSEKEKEEAMQTAQRVYLQSLEPPLNSPPTAEVSSSEDSGFRRYRTSAGDRERRRSRNRKESQESPQTRRGRKRKFEGEVATSKQSRLDKITDSLLDKVATTLATMATSTTTTAVSVATASSSQGKKSASLVEGSDDSDSPLVIDEENEGKVKGRAQGPTSSRSKRIKDDRFERIEASEVLLQLSQSGGNESSDNNHPTMVRPDSNHPTMVRPDSNHPTMVRPDSNHPTMVRPDSNHPTMVRPDSNHPTMVQPSLEPDQLITKPDQPQSSSKPEATDTIKPDAPDTSKPAKPDAKLQPRKLSKEPDNKHHPKEPTGVENLPKIGEKVPSLRTMSTESGSKEERSLERNQEERRRRSDEAKPKSGRIFLDDTFLVGVEDVKRAKVKTKDSKKVKPVKSLKVKPTKLSHDKVEDAVSSSSKEKLESAKQKFLHGKATLAEAAESGGITPTQLRASLVAKHGVISAPEKGDFMLGSDEEVIVNWIHDVTDLGWGILDQHISEKIRDFLTKEMYSVVFGDGCALNQPCNQWLDEFLGRHPEIFPGRKLPLTRFRIDREGFEDWRLRWLTTLHTVDVAPNGVFYLDEVVWDTNPKLMHNVTFTHPVGNPRPLTGLGTKSKITTLTCIGANGIPLKPFHVFPEGSVTVNEQLMMTSQSGTMDSEVLLSWFWKVFLEEIGRRRPVALLVDSHLAHLCFSLLKVAEENHVVIYNFLPAGAHFLQHPDQKLFGRLRMQWKKSIIRQFLKTNALHEVSTHQFADYFNQEFQGVATSSNIKTCFALTKMYNPVAEPTKEKKNKRKMLKPVAYIEDKQEVAEVEQAQDEAKVAAKETELFKEVKKAGEIIEDKAKDILSEATSRKNSGMKSSVSPEKNESVSPEKNESVSTEKNESVSPEKNESVSPEKNENISPEKNENISPGKNENISPENESVSPEKNENFVSPEKNENFVSPEKNESVSPEKNESVSPEKNEKFVSPSTSSSVSPSTSTSVSPSKGVSISPSTSVSPSKGVSISPSTSVSPKYKKGYKRGETVLAKWSDCRLYSATILKKLGQGKYKVRYYDGLVKVLKDDFLRPWGSVDLLPQRPKVTTPPKVASPRRRSLEVKGRSRRISELSEERKRRLSENLESATEKSKARKASPQKAPVDYELGEQVLCKWTDRKFYPATILKKITEDAYKVKYYDNRKKIVQTSWLQPWKPSSQSPDKVRTSIEQPISVKVEVGNPAQELTGNPGVSVSVKSITVVEKVDEPTYTQATRGETKEAGKVEGGKEDPGKAPKEEGRFGKGDSVLARWTDCRVYPATILKCMQEDQYVVQYYDGMTRTLKGEMMKRWDPASAPKMKNKKSDSDEVPASKETAVKSLGGKPCFSTLQNHEFCSNKPEPSLTKFKCEMEGCGKVFRKEAVLQQHHKHCHQQPIKSLQISPAHKKKLTEKTSVKRKLSTDSTQGNSRPKEGTPRSKGGKPPLDVYRMHANLNSEEMMETSPEASKKKKIKSAVDDKKPSDHVVRCTCQSNRGGQLIRCRSCNYWQHCDCEGIPHNEDNQDYVCKQCSSPPGGRKSGIYLFNNDFLTKGKLPVLSHKSSISGERSVEEGIVEVREEKKKAREIQSLMTSSHQLISDLSKIKDSLHSMKRKIRTVPSDNIRLLETFKETNLNMEDGREENGGISSENGGISSENGGGGGKMEGIVENGGNVGKMKENGGNGGNVEMESSDKTKSDGVIATPSGSSEDNTSTTSGSLWAPIKIKKTYTPVVTSSQSACDVTKEEELLRCRSNLLTHIHGVQDCLSERLKKLEECVEATEKAYERCTGESPNIREFEEVQNDCDVIHDLLVTARDQ